MKNALKVPVLSLRYERYSSCAPRGIVSALQQYSASDIIINDYRERLAHYLSTLSELLRSAVKAVIDYVQSGYRSFSYRQEGDVRCYMNGQPDKDEAANTVLNASRPFLKSDECERVKGQLCYIVQDMKEECQQSRSRGFHI